jgi:hypothetical protein
MPDASGIPTDAELMDVRRWLPAIAQKEDVDLVSPFCQKARQVKKPAVGSCQQILSLGLPLG